jgi:predicted SprT family Zn-dependent metalloprotease
MNHEITPLRAPSLEIQAFKDPIPEYLPVALELALNREQKEAIRKRDHYRCQFPEHQHGNCPCHGRLEIHHILPQGYAKLLEINPDFPENVLLICQYAHDLIHADVAEAKKHYKPKGESFLRVSEKHLKALEIREPYCGILNSIEQ